MSADPLLLKTVQLSGGLAARVMYSPWTESRLISDNPHSEIDSMQNPIVIYQMGRVGSYTIHQSLTARELGVPIYHAHLLGNLDTLGAFARHAYLDPQATLAEIERGGQFSETVAALRHTGLDVITLVRDPIRRNISAFFHNIGAVVPERYCSEAYLGALVDVFIKDYNHNAPLEWFDSQFKPSFNIDVFATEFSKHIGYATYQQEQTRVLLLRLEDLNRVGAKALKEFLGISTMTLLNANNGAAGKYGSLYRAFLERAVLPGSYVEAMCTSKYAEHFYSDEERKGWLSWWTREGDVERL